MKKVIVITSIVLFVLLAGLAIFVQSDAFSVRIRRYVVERMTATLGEGVHIGWVKANLIPLYVEVRDITLLDTEGREKVGIHKVRAYINPLALLVKKLSLPLIVINDPRLNIERSAGGETNFAQLVEMLRQRISASPATTP